MNGPAIAVVIVTHNSAPQLPLTLGGLREQLVDGDEVVVVDNASDDGSPECARELLPGATIVETGANLGFAAGCQAGARASGAPLLLFLNPDCTPQPGCLEALRTCAAERPNWAIWQALVTLDDGRTVNSAGNVVHYLGFGWAGGLGRLADAIPPHPHEVPFASGAALVIRRPTWEAAGGFDERYFMYGEDLDLSLRVRLAGAEVGLVPAARVAHEYQFAKGSYKWFYLERNRWWTVLSDYPASLLAAVAPALLLFEAVLLAVAWRGGWLGPKLRAQATVIRELPQILRRRRSVQATRRIPAHRFAQSLTASLDSPHLAAGASIPGAVRLQCLYWRAVRSLLRALGK